MDSRWSCVRLVRLGLYGGSQPVYNLVEGQLELFFHTVEVIGRVGYGQSTTNGDL